jgi:ATP-binding cassette subfamily B protein
MMFVISPLLAFALVMIQSVCLPQVSPAFAKAFVDQWKHRYAQRAMKSYSGHALVKVFGRWREINEAFQDEKTYKG